MSGIRDKCDMIKIAAGGEELLMTEIDPIIAKRVRGETGFIKNRRPQTYVQ